MALATVLARVVLAGRLFIARIACATRGPLADAFSLVRLFYGERGRTKWFAEAGLRFGIAEGFSDGWGCFWLGRWCLTAAAPFLALFTRAALCPLADDRSQILSPSVELALAPGEAPVRVAPAPPQRRGRRPRSDRAEREHSRKARRKGDKSARQHSRLPAVWF